MSMVTVRVAYNLKLPLLYLKNTMYIFAAFELDKLPMHTSRGKTIICPYKLEWLATLKIFQN